MCKDKQTIHYCTILSDEQWIFLLEGKSSTLRQKCLHRLMTDAVRTKTSYKIKGIDIVLGVGQVAVSDVELAEFLDCNRKTVGKLIDKFNRLGMLTTRTNNRTSIHTLHFLTGWYVGGVLITNPHYVRPSATSKGLTGDVRTPVSGSSPSEGKRNAVLDNNRTTIQDTDSMATGAAVLSSSLCSSENSNQPTNGQESGNRQPQSDSDADNKTEIPHIIDGDYQPPCENSAESPKEAQDGTNEIAAIGYWDEVSKAHGEA